MLGLEFDAGTLLVRDAAAAGGRLDAWLAWDDRVGAHRSAACRYAEILRALHPDIPYADHARAYHELELTEQDPLPLRDYQQQALSAWGATKRRGVVVLPTGTGKTYVAVRAILTCRRSTLVLAPTIDLVRQWADELHARLGTPIGRYGGGDKDLQEITVATYDSGILIAPYFGDRFGLLVCDECHHLPAEMTRRVAECCIAPFRLGLSATPERDDGLHDLLVDLVGPTVHRTGINEIEGTFLADYQAELVEVALDPDEAEAYRHHRSVYLGFLRASGVDLRRREAWQEFLGVAARDPQGREALGSWREQKRLSRASRSKLRACWKLLREHPGERCLVFTDDNATAYAIGREMVLPVLTHHTRPAERQELLADFRSGELPILVTSRVLNEGVDVPEATVGIVVSGTGSVREHVQRLGRILRPGPGKTARLYELVSADTAEGYTSARRRRHAAFGEEDDLFGDGDADA